MPAIGETTCIEMPEAVIMSSAPERTCVSIAASEPSWAFGKNWMSMRPSDCLRMSAQASSMALEEGWLSANCPPIFRLTFLPCANDGAAQSAVIDPIAVAPNCRLFRAIVFSGVVRVWRSGLAGRRKSGECVDCEHIAGGSEARDHAGDAVR